MQFQMLLDSNHDAASARARAAAAFGSGNSDVGDDDGRHQRNAV